MTIRVRINDSELSMLKQLLDNCSPEKDLNNFNGERQAVHTFSVKLLKGFKCLEKKSAEGGKG